MTTSLVAGPAIFYASALVGPQGRLSLRRSEDGGETWSEISLGVELERDFRLSAADPRDPDSVYGVIDGIGLLRSEDGGETWSAIHPYQPASLVFDPADPSRLYLGANLTTPLGTSGNVFRSSDGGDSWQEAGDGLPPPDTGVGRRVGSLAVDAAASSTLYAVVVGEGLFRSTDGAETWTRLTDVPGPSSGTGRIEIAPTSPPTVLRLVAEGLYRSIDGGDSWTLSYRNAEGAALRALVIDPLDPPVIYAGTVTARDSKRIGGVLRSSDGGATWTPSNAGLDQVAIGEVVFDALGDTIYAETTASRESILRTLDRGATWTVRRQFLGPIESLAVGHGSFAFATAVGSDRGIYRTVNGGDTWEAVFACPQSGRARLAVDPTQTRFVYAIDCDGRDRLLRSEDSGDTWESVPIDLGGAGAWSVAVAPGTGDVYVGASTGRVVRSHDRGLSWAAITEDFLLTGASELYLDPWSDRVYAVLLDHSLYRLDSGSARWQRTGLRALHQVRSLAFDPLDPSILYVGTDSGVFVSFDRSESFRPLARASLGSRRVEGLTFDPQAQRRRLVAGTSGGVFEIDVIPPTKTLSLAGGRFEAEVSWIDFEGQTGTGNVAVVPGPTGVDLALGSRDSAVVEFFGGGNWELLLKVLDGRAINGHFWVFFGAATDVGYSVTVTDTSCGQTKSYVNPLGLAARAVTDETAFEPCAEPAPPSCVADESTLCLGDGRFAVEIIWTDFLGQTGHGRQVRIPEAGLARSQDSGLFYFFSEDNWELLIKVLDGCAINGHFWFFSAATTDVGYAVTVTDSATGTERTYSNRLGLAAAATTDTQAFAPCE